MSKNILCLSGWGQKFDSLEVIFNESSFDPFFVSSFDYSVIDNVEEVFSTIKLQKINPEIVVGWSLGGQLAVRLIEKKIITPKLLILLAPPFQMLKNERVQAGMSKDVFEKFYQDFISAPNQTLKQFAILTAMNDRNAKQIAQTLDISDRNFTQLKFWLEELSRFSCFDVDFSNMPRTLFFQGLGDMIVHQSQANYFKKYIGDFRLELMSNCGHAPHLSNVDFLRKVILEEVFSF